MPEQEIVSSRLFLVAVMVGILGFGAITSMLPHDRQARWWLYGMLALFAGRATVLLIRPHRLSLGDTGFTLSGGFARSAKRVAWHDVDRFRVEYLPKQGRRVRYRLTERARGDAGLSGHGRRHDGYRTIPPMPGKSPDVLAADLNRRLAAAGRR